MRNGDRMANDATTSTADPPAASVIVVGYNSRPHLPACLAALARQRYAGSMEVLFVDNASTDGSADYVRRSCPGVRVIESGGNLGYAGGNNFAARHASGAVLAFLNPDTRPEPDWLRELVAPLQRDATIGMTTSKLVLMDEPGVINTCGNDLSLAGLTTCRHAGAAAGSVDEDEEVTAVSGAAFAVRRELFERLGGFDERFWMYLEDTDLTWRARLAGYRAMCAARSVAAHQYSLTLPPQKTELLERNRYLMLAKNSSAWSLLVLWPFFLAAELLTWGWAGLRGRRHLQAKLRATLWVLGHPKELGCRRADVRRVRELPDGQLLRRHRPLPPVADVAADGLGRRVAGLLDPLAGAAAGPTYWLLDAPSSVTGAGQHRLSWVMHGLRGTSH